MMNQMIEQLRRNLTERGYEVVAFSSGIEAAQYLNGEIHEKTVAIGGSLTAKQLGLYHLLETHNTVFWHWMQQPESAKKNGALSQVYISSVNAAAITGELVNIDGNGNRVASVAYGHETLYLLIGSNKIVPTYEDAVWRARNIAAPKRAQQLGKNTPCAVNADRCYNCKSPERICRVMETLWGPTSEMHTVVILIDEVLGL